MNENFCNFIKELRIHNRLTQKELANMLGVSDKAVSKWEVGDSYPDISLLCPIAETLGVSVDELLKGEADTVKTDFRGCFKPLLINIASNTVLIIAVLVLIFLSLLETDSTSSIAFSITDQKQFLVISLIIVLVLAIFISIYNFLQFKKIERRNKDEEVSNK